MATVTVTKQFKEDFDVWANDVLSSGEFTNDDMEELKTLLRKDFQPGPDHLRDCYELIIAGGAKVPAAIDNYEDRIKAWTDFFSVCANEIRNRYRRAA